MDLMHVFNENKDKVWQLSISRITERGVEEHHYTGVCIEKGGTILTHAFEAKGKSLSISLTNSHNQTYAGKIIRHKPKQGLALLKMKEKVGDFPYVQFGDESKIVAHQPLYAITYPESSIKPFLLLGYVAYAPYRIVGEKYGGLNDITKLNAEVRLLQINDLGASNEIIRKDELIQEGLEGDSQISKSCYGLSEARGCPLFDVDGGLVGIVLFQLEDIDFAAHVSDIKSFVEGYMGPSCEKGKDSSGPLYEKGKEKEKRKRQ